MLEHRYHNAHLTIQQGKQVEEIVDNFDKLASFVSCDDPNERLIEHTKQAAEKILNIHESNAKTLLIKA
jgi:di/tripeptidase